jgi:hypothetical protein
MYPWTLKAVATRVSPSAGNTTDAWLEVFVQYPWLPQLNNYRKEAINVVINVQLNLPTQNLKPQAPFYVDVGNSTSVFVAKLAPGDSVSAKWLLHCNKNTGACDHSTHALITAEGLINDFVPWTISDTPIDYPPYSYVDVIGGETRVKF